VPDEDHATLLGHHPPDDRKNVICVIVEGERRDRRPCRQQLRIVLRALVAVRELGVEPVAR